MYKLAVEKVRTLPVSKEEQEDILKTEISKFLNKFTKLSVEVTDDIVKIQGIGDKVFTSYIEKLGAVEGFKVVVKEVKVVA